MKRAKPQYPSSIAVTLILGLNGAIASHALADVRLSGKVNTNLVHQIVDASETNEDYVDRSTLQVTPSLTATYESKRASLAVTGTQLFQEFDPDNESATNSYPQFNYAGQFAAIDNVLQFFANGSQQYQAVQAGSFVVSDFLLNAEELSKVTSHNVGTVLTIREGAFWGGSVSASMFRVKSDRSSDSTSDGINADGTSVSGTVRNGDWFTNAYWNATGSFQITERTTLGKYEALSANAQWGYGLFADIAFMLNATHSENDVDDELSAGLSLFNSQFEKFTTYGAGFTYRPGESRYISIAANKVATDGEDDGKVFMSADLQWQFSSRTRIRGSYGRRYYGDAGSFSFRYGTRSTRSIISYEESTTTYSNLLFSLQDAGTFVCGADAADIGDCFQPDTLDYDLGVDEQFVQFSQVVSELTDQLILRKQVNGTFGFDRRKLNVSFDASYIDTQFSENERQQINKGAGVNASLQLGSRSSLFARIQRSHTTDRLNGLESLTDNMVYTLGFRNKLSKNLTINTELRYLDTDTQGDNIETEELSVFTLNATRASIGITYKFL